MTAIYQHSKQDIVIQRFIYNVSTTAHKNTKKPTPPQNLQKLCICKNHSIEKIQCKITAQS